MIDKTNRYHDSVYLANLSDVKNQSLKSDIEKANKNYAKATGWINIKEKSVIQLIVEAFVDPQKKNILNHTTERALTGPEILEICKMPTTSGYRAINSLIKSGLLVIKSIGYTKNGRKINKYKSIFENVKIKIEKNKVSVYAKFAKV